MPYIHTMYCTYNTINCLVTHHHLPSPSLHSPIPTLSLPGLQPVGGHRAAHAGSVRRDHQWAQDRYSESHRCVQIYC